MANWDRFGYIPVGRILDELKQDGLNITRDTFRRLEREGLFMSGRTIGGWRRYTREEADIIKHLIKQNFAFKDQEHNNGDNTPT